MTLAGSLFGTKDGMNLGCGTSGLAFSKVMPFDGNPDTKLTGNIGSDLVLDVVNNELYICDAQGGSDWTRLIV